MAIIDNLQLEISAQSTKATTHLRSLGNELKAFKSNANVGSAVKNLQALKSAIQSLNRINVKSDNYKSLASGVRSINNAVSQIKLSSVNRVERLASALWSLGLVAKSSSSSVSKAKDVAESVSEEPKESEVGVAEGSAEDVKLTKEEMKKLKEETKAAEKRANELRAAFKSIVGNAITKNLRGLSDTFRRIGDRIRRMVAPIKNLFRSIGRIALYRALRTIIKEITQGIKEGTDNLVRFSALMNGKDAHNANKVLSQYASNFLYLKNTLGTAVVPLLKTLEPLISSVIQRMVDLIDVFAQFFSVLTGNTNYTKAKYYFVDYAESLDKASGSAGKLNKQLAQFDELNNLTTSSGSGATAAEDVLQMFEDPVPIADWIKKLKEYIDRGEWKELGLAISGKITDSLNEINWDENYKKANQFGTNLAKFLNGLIQPDTFHALGKTLAGGIMTAIEFAFSFGDEFDWATLGLSIAEGINGFFEEFDGGKLADTIDVWVKGMFTTLCVAAKKIDWKEVFKDLFDFFTHLDIGTVALFVGLLTIKQGVGFAITIASGVLLALKNKLIDYLAKQIFPVKVTPTVSAGAAGAAGAGNAAKGIAIGAGASGTVSGLGAFGAAAATFAAVYSWTNAFGEIMAMILPGGEFMGLSDEEWAAANPIYKIFKKENVEGFFFQLFDSIHLDKAIQDFFQPMAEWWYGEDGFWVKVKRGGEEFGQFWYGEDGVWAKFSKKIQEVGEKVYGESGFWQNIDTKAKEVGESIYGEEGFWAGVKNGAIEAGGAIYGDEGFWANLKEEGIKVGDAIYGKDGFWAKIGKKSEEIGEKIYGKDGFWANFKDGLVKAWNDVTQSFKDGWNNLKTFFGQNPISFSGVESAAAGVTSLTNLAQNIKLRGFASGGYPTVGSLFVAGEQGAELVGDFNGRTGVANNDQITEAMYAATYDAMSKALSENQLVIESDADMFFNVMRQKANSYTRRTGNPAF